METMKQKNDKLKFIIYARKSTESEDRQAISIQSQLFEMKEIAKRENLRIAKVFKESKSAKAPGRPLFNEMVEVIKQGKADGILCWKIDRLARNPVDEGIIKWLLQNETIKQIKTFDRVYNPQDNVVIASIEFSMANQYIRDLSSNVKRGFKEKVRRGEYPGTAPLGYVRNLRTKRIDIDTKNYHYVKTAFQLYSTGAWSLKRLAKKLYEDGFRTHRKKEVYKSVIHTMLSNPIYCGLFRWKGQIHKGVHSPIVSQSLFNKAQINELPSKHLKRIDKRWFAFRGLLSCHCGLKITAEIKKGHTYYRCTKSRGVENCDQKYIREEALIKEIDKWLDSINFDEDVLDLIIEATKEKFQMEQEYKQESKKILSKLLEKNKSRQNSLVEKFIDSFIPENTYNQKLSELRNEESGIEEKLKNFESADKNIIEKIELIMRFTKLARELFDQGDEKIKKEVVSILASNIVINNQKIASVKLNEPFIWLYEDTKNFAFEKPAKPIFEPLLFSSYNTKTAPHEVYPI